MKEVVLVQIKFKVDSLNPTSVTVLLAPPAFHRKALQVQKVPPFSYEPSILRALLDFIPYKVHLLGRGDLH